MGRGHKYLGKRRWDEAFQKVVGLEVPWKEAAQDRQQWNRMEVTFVQKVARRTLALDEIPTGRFMVQDTSRQRSVHIEASWTLFLKQRKRQFEPRVELAGEHEWPKLGQHGQNVIEPARNWSDTLQIRPKRPKLCRGHTHFRPTSFPLKTSAQMARHGPRPPQIWSKRAQLLSTPAQVQSRPPQF